MTDRKAMLELAAKVEQAIPQPNTNEWQDHDGGGRPHPPGSYVEVEFRGGAIRGVHSALLMWPWENDDDDVLRWRFVPEPLSRIRAGELLIEHAATIAAALRARAAQ